MKYLLLSLALLLSTPAMSDQRFETVGGFCHFILNAQNDDNEVYFANCLNSIVQNNDGTGNGSTIILVTYPTGSAPISEDITFTGTDTGIPCIMVDSNGTTYQTNDWDSEYKILPSKNNLDRVSFSLSCRNAQQQ